MENQTPPAPASDASPALAQAPGYRRFRHDATLKLKQPCPYCGGKLTATAHAWEDAEEGGGMVATDLDINCDTEPDIDPVRNLVKAGALIAAEIDRINRQNASDETRGR